MKHLIIYANPVQVTFCQFIKDSIIECSSELGDAIELRDLYKMNFSPVLTPQDLTGFRNGNITDDIKEEQRWIAWADVITFIYPIWWSGMPAILKGYIDRVFSYGFAYGNFQNEIIGLLAKKKAIIFSTHGQSQEEYEKNGMYNAINITTDIGIFDFCGIEVLHHLYYSDTGKTPDETKQEWLDEVELVIKHLKR